MAAKPRARILVALVVLGSLAGCSSKGQQTEPPAEDAPTATVTEASPTPDGTPTETPEVEPDDTDDALPAGFPDPAALVGQVVHDAPAADGSWHTVVSGAPLTLTAVMGACFDGGSGDVCGYSVSVSVPPGPAPQPASAALVLLLRAEGTLGDGTPTWTVLDAVATSTPGDAPAYIELCDGTEGVVIWSDPDAPAGDTIPVLAAWGPDATVTSLVEVDPASLSCPWMGD